MLSVYVRVLTLTSPLPRLGNYGLRCLARIKSKLKDRVIGPSVHSQCDLACQGVTKSRKKLTPWVYKAFTKGYNEDDACDGVPESFGEWHSPRHVSS